MAFVLNDRVKETTTSTGTGTINLNGAGSGFETFVTGIGNGNETFYCITAAGTGNFEVGIGTVTDATPDTLSRTTVLSSSNSDSLVNFGAGTKDVFCTLPASKAVLEDESNNVAIGNNITLGGTVDGRDLQTDGTKLDGIEAGATADQTQSEINALGITAGGSRKFYVNATNAYFQNLTQMQIDGGNFYVDGHTGLRMAPDSNIALKLLQSSTLTHGAYFQINGGSAVGLEINATSGSFSGTALYLSLIHISEPTRPY